MHRVTCLVTATLSKNSLCSRKEQECNKARHEHRRRRRRWDEMKEEKPQWFVHLLSPYVKQRDMHACGHNSHSILNFFYFHGQATRVLKTGVMVFSPTGTCWESVRRIPLEITRLQLKEIYVLNIGEGTKDLVLLPTCDWATDEKNWDQMGNEEAGRHDDLTTR